MPPVKGKRKKRIYIPGLMKRKRLPADGPMSRKALLELVVVSAGLFVYAALAAQFLLTLITGFILRIFSFSFTYRPFLILFTYVSDLNWSENRIYAVFITGPLILSILGWFIYFRIKRQHRIPWRLKLFLTWFAFICANSFPAGILAGSLFYEGFGVAFQWLIPITLIRLLIGLIVLALLILTSRLWLKSFLKASYSSVFFNDADDQYEFLVSAFFKSWVLGMMILLPFNYPFTGWFWPASILCLGFPAFMLLDYTHRYRGLKIMRPATKVIAGFKLVAVMVVSIIILWVLGMWKMEF
jgi:hypothetical protein